MSLIKNRKPNWIKIAEDIYIELAEIHDGCVGLVVEVPVGVPVTLEQTVARLTPDPNGTWLGTSIPPESPD